jgi:hypothetical protein
MIGPSSGEQLRVDGNVTYNRLFDVGYSIDLDRAAAVLGDSTRGRVRPAREEARAIQIQNPPLLVALGTSDVMVDGAPRSAGVSAHLFDFGVCSIQMRIELPVGSRWSTMVHLGNGIDHASDAALVAEQALHALTGRIAGAIERPRVAPLTEEYRVYRVDRLERDHDDDAKPAAEKVTDDELAALLIGERRPLSVTARRELMPYRFSYYDDDLVVLTWESALVVEPNVENRDVEYVLEFANAQLLELRLFDRQLDADLPSLYDRVEIARARRPWMGERFRSVLSELQTRVADMTETTERVENALKLTNDVYLARVYSAGLDLFREQEWRRGLERKLGILRETYSMLNSEAQVARAEVLEIAIVVLIVAELVLGIFVRH